MSLGLYTKMTTLGCLTIIKNKKWAESFEFLSFYFKEGKSVYVVAGFERGDKPEGLGNAVKP